MMGFESIADSRRRSSDTSRPKLCARRSRSSTVTSRKSSIIPFGSHDLGHPPPRAWFFWRRIRLTTTAHRTTGQTTFTMQMREPARKTKGSKSPYSLMWRFGMQNSPLSVVRRCTVHHPVGPVMSTTCGILLFRKLPSKNKTHLTLRSGITAAPGWSTFRLVESLPRKNECTGIRINVVEVIDVRM